MQPRIIRSGPDQALLTTPMSQWQRDRAGRVQPATLPVSRWEARAVYLVVGIVTITVAMLGVSL